MIRVLVSACLLGEKVRYNGADARRPAAVLDGWSAEGRVVAFCPEVAGGLGVPRPAAEIQGGDGRAVLSGAAAVRTKDGRDVTPAFLEGARLALEQARRSGARVAVLKEGSPSCGSGSIHDGTFSGRKKGGAGVTASLLEQNGIRVFSEGQIAEAAAYIATLEDEDGRAPARPTR